MLLTLSFKKYKQPNKVHEIEMSSDQIDANPTTEIPRRTSISSMRSITSIDEFRSSPFDEYIHNKQFPLRPTINILIILLTTLQVYLLINSRIYLRGELVRSFLSIYVEQDRYPSMFDGGQFYLEITNVGELRDHFAYLFKRVNQIDEDSFIDYFYKDAKIVLHTAYKQFAGRQHRKNVHPIDPKQGIVQPFNMSNITDIQVYLLQIEEFQLQIQNLLLHENWEGFSETYTHEITYSFVDSIKVRVNFEFRISNAMVKPDVEHDDYPQKKSNIQEHVMERGEDIAKRRLRMGDCLQGCYFKSSHSEQENNFRNFYIVRVRVFYGFVLLVSLVSLYLNYVSIRKTYKILYQQLEKKPLTQSQQRPAQAPSVPSHPSHSFLTHQEYTQLLLDIQKWVQANNLTISDIKPSHYIHILEFDLIFSTLSNIFEIITAFYLVSGIERERLAGIVCLFSWMTIFKLVRNYKKLVIMYQLIKVSIVQVMFFFVEFLPVFIAYALLGVCLFPKVRFFASLADSVTTLVCLMMGDSIQLITGAIREKNSTTITMIYIFSFVLLFMHAIHNTLTSIIKEFFIIKKIELVTYEKNQKNENSYLYLSEVKTNSEQEKQKLPIKITEDLRRGLMRVEAVNRTKRYQQASVMLLSEIENVRMTEKWMLWELELETHGATVKEVGRRLGEVTRAVAQVHREGEGAGFVPVPTVSSQSDISSTVINQSTVSNAQVVMKESLLSDI